MTSYRIWYKIKHRSIYYYVDDFDVSNYYMLEDMPLYLFLDYCIWEYNNGN